MECNRGTARTTAGRLWTKKEEADSLELACSLVQARMLGVVGELQELGPDGDQGEKERLWGSIDALTGVKATLSVRCLGIQIEVSNGHGKCHYDEVIL